MMAQRPSEAEDFVGFFMKWFCWFFCVGFWFRFFLRTAQAYTVYYFKC